MNTRGYVTFNSWLGENSNFGGLADPLKAILFGGNVGHASVEVVIEKNEETERFLASLDDTLLKITESSENILENGVVVPKRVYKVYFSFWPDNDDDNSIMIKDFFEDKTSEREGRKANPNPDLSTEMKEKMSTEQKPGQLSSTPRQVFSGAEWTFHSAIFTADIKGRMLALLDKQTQSLGNKIEENKQNGKSTSTEETMLKGIEKKREKLDKNNLDRETIEFLLNNISNEIGKLERELAKENIPETKAEIEKNIASLEKDKETIQRNFFIGLPPDTSMTSGGSLDGKYGFDLKAIIEAMHDVSKNKKYDFLCYNCSDSAYDVLLAGVTENIQQEMIMNGIAAKETFKPISLMATPAVATKKALILRDAVEKLEEHRAVKNFPYYLQVHQAITISLLNMMDPNNKDLSKTLQSNLKALSELAINEANKNGNGKAYLEASKAILSNLHATLKHEKDPLVKKEFESLQKKLFKLERQKVQRETYDVILDENKRTGLRGLKDKFSAERKNIQSRMVNFLLKSKNSIDKIIHRKNPMEIRLLVRQVDSLAQRYFNAPAGDITKEAIRGELKEKFLLLKSYHEQFENDHTIKNQKISNKLGEAISDTYKKHVNSFNREFGTGMKDEERMLMKRYDDILKEVNNLIAKVKDPDILKKLNDFKKGLDTFVSTEMQQKQYQELDRDKLTEKALALSEGLGLQSLEATLKEWLPQKQNTLRV